MAGLCTQTQERASRLESQKVFSQLFSQRIRFSSDFHHFVTFAQMSFSSFADQMFASLHIGLIGEL